MRAVFVASTRSRMPCTPKVRNPAPKESSTLSTPASSMAWRRVVSKSRRRSCTTSKYSGPRWPTAASLRVSNRPSLSRMNTMGWPKCSSSAILRKGTGAGGAPTLGRLGTGIDFLLGEVMVQARRYDADLCFHFLELFHGASTPRTSDAAVLEATLFESVVEGADAPGVGPYGARLDGASDSLCAIEIVREDRRRQAVDGGIRTHDRLILRRKRLEAQHRAEYLLLNQRYVQPVRLQHGRAIKCSGRQGAVDDGTAANNDS